MKTFHALDRRFDDVWNSVFDHFTPPIPKPLSGMHKRDRTGCPTQEGLDALPDEGSPEVTQREAIRKDVFAVLMRTCIAFNLLVTPRLYSVIICDDICRLTEGLEQPSAHSHIESKQQLLQRTHRLHLEYRRKDRDPTYFSIMADPRNWSAFADWDVNRTRDLYAQLAHEIGDVDTALTRLVQPTQIGKVFTKLEYLTVGAIFGGQELLWRTAADPKSGWNLVWPRESGPDTTSPAWLSVFLLQRMMADAFRGSPLLHVCQRLHWGPLAFPPLINWEGEGEMKQNRLTDPLFTVHINGRLKHDIPAAIGYRTRWVLSPEPGQSGPSFLAGSIIPLFDSAVASLWKALDTRRTSEPSVHVEIYASSHYSDSPFLDRSGNSALMLYKPDAERLMAVSCQEHIDEQRAAAPGPDKRASFVWRSSLDSEPCRACSWKFEREEVRYEDHGNGSDMLESGEIALAREGGADSAE